MNADTDWYNLEIGGVNMGSVKNTEFKGKDIPELRYLIEAYRADDETAFDKLAEIYRPLIDSMVARCAEGLSEVCAREDVMQYALIAFSKAILTYKLDQDKVSFGLYAKICIGNALVSRVRAARQNHVEVLPLDGFFDMADSTDVPGDVIDSERVGELHELIRCNLSDFENDVFWLYATGYSSSEIADRLGKTEKSVDNAIFRARKKLKSVLNGTPKRSPI